MDNVDFAELGHERVRIQSHHDQDKSSFSLLVADKDGLRAPQHLQMFIRDFQQAETREGIFVICLLFAAIVQLAALALTICGAFN